MRQVRVWMRGNEYFQGRNFDKKDTVCRDVDPLYAVWF